MTRSKQPGRIIIPVEVSNRHIHVSQRDFETMYGHGSSLHIKRPISQTGQFAAEETVILKGPKATIEHVRIVGPWRDRTQVELSRTDARRLGVSPPLRDSGDLKGSAGITLVGPKDAVELAQGVIIQRRHIHATQQDCSTYGLRPGATVNVRIKGERGVVFDNVLVKVDPSFVWRLHLDTDEANAAGVSGGEHAEVIL